MQDAYAVALAAVEAVEVDEQEAILVAQSNLAFYNTMRDEAFLVSYAQEQFDF